MRIAALSLLISAVLAFAPAAQAVTIDWIIKLDGSQEEPEPVVTGALGMAHVTYDTETNLFDVTAFVHGLTKDALIDADPFGLPEVIPFHVHIENDSPPTDQVGPIQVVLGDLDDWVDDTPGIGMHLSVSGIAWGNPLDPPDAAEIELLEDALLAGEGYLNLHTSSFPGGEIRGDIPGVELPEPAAVSLVMLGLALASSSGIRRRS